MENDEADKMYDRWSDAVDRSRDWARDGGD